MSIIPRIGLRRPPPSWLPFAVIATVGALAYLPALRSPFFLDDYIHNAMISGTFPVHRGPLDLYNFVDDADREALIARGLFPWWTHHGLTLHFFRPLSSALLWLEHRALGRHPLAFHIHSFAWWMLAVFAVQRLLRRFFSRRASWIGAAIFGLAPCHSIPLGWLANREVLISISIGVFALGAYTRWREERRANDGLFAAALFSIAMLGGEYTLCFGGYVLAFELFGARESLTRRLLGLVPFVAPAAIYLALRSWLGFGTRGSGFYHDPFQHPLAFLRSVPKRLVVLVAESWFTMDDQVLNAGTPWLTLAALLVVTLLVAGPPIARSWKGLPPSGRGAVKWLTGGSVLSILPVLAVVPSVRLIGIATIGVAAAVAVFLEHAWFEPATGTRRQRELTATTALLVGFLHLVHGPGTSWRMSRDVQNLAVNFAKRASWLSARVRETENPRIVMLHTPWQTALFAPFELEPDGRPPEHWQVLALGRQALALRQDAQTIDIVIPKGGSFFPTGDEDLFRTVDAPMHTGDEVSVPGMRATILSTGGSEPPRVRFTFDRDLDDPSFVWLADEVAGMREVTIPAPGFGTPLGP